MLLKFRLRCCTTAALLIVLAKMCLKLKPWKMVNLWSYCYNSNILNITPITILWNTVSLKHLIVKKKKSCQFHYCFISIIFCLPYLIDIRCSFRLICNYWLCEDYTYACVNVFFVKDGGEITLCWNAALFCILTTFRKWLESLFRIWKQVLMFMDQWSVPIYKLF